jgi:hypothetical protein
MNYKLLGRLQYNLINGNSKIRLYRTVNDAFNKSRKQSDLYELKNVIKSTFRQSSDKLQLTYHSNIKDKIVFSFKVGSKNKPTRFSLIDTFEFE